MPDRKRRLPSWGAGLTDLLMFRRTWWQHILFWGLIGLALLHIFKTSGKILRIDLIYTAFFLFPLMVIAYLNLYRAIPRLLRRERYLFYILSFLGLSAGGAVLLSLIFDRWIDWLLPEYFFISYYTFPILMLFTGSILILTTLLKLSRSWFRLVRIERSTGRERIHTLQAQINPHFLLNALQTIYALSLEKAPDTPETVLRLSDILKYTLYETDHPQVPLQHELDAIRDYADMYRRRVDPARAEIRFRTEGEAGERLIAPMLLLPFVENAFKHGLTGGPGKVYVHIEIHIDEKQLLFHTVNSRLKADPPPEKKHRGIGIENTRQRLALLYPGHYRLSFGPDGNTYHVELKLTLEP